MATATSRRISTGIAWSTFGVLAWATLSILTSSGAAHAEEEPDGLLGNVTSIVAPLVTEVVTPVVADVVAPILQTPVAQVASEAVPAVTDLLQDSPVSSITTPILDAATAVPVVGDVLSRLGVPGAVDDVAAVVDTTDSGVSPQSDIPTGIVSAPITALASAETSAAASTATMLTGRLFDDSGATLATVDDSADASDVPSLPAKAAHAPPGSPAPSSSAGHGAGPVGDGARLADTPVDSLHYWKRTLGAPDDDLPSSPVAETDTSPD